MTTNYQALIFDCDGTLADTMPGHFIAWSQTMRRYGIDFPEDRFYALGGVPTTKIVALLAEEAGVTLDVAAVAEEKEAAFHEQALHAVRPVEPVVAIARAHRHRIPMAVATGSARWSAQRVLEHINIFHWFDAFVGAEDTERHKPEPDVFLEAARRLDVPPAACCVYEDTEPGIEAARRAGMAVIDVRPMYLSAR